MHRGGGGGHLETWRRPQPIHVGVTAVDEIISHAAGSGVANGVVPCVIKLEFHGTDTNTDFRDAPIV